MHACTFINYLIFRNWSMAIMRMKNLVQRKTPLQRRRILVRKRVKKTPMMMRE